MADGSRYLQQSTIGPTIYQENLLNPLLPVSRSSSSNGLFLQSLLSQFIAPLNSIPTPVPNSNLLSQALSQAVPPTPSRSPDIRGSPLSQTLQGMYNHGQSQGHTSRLNSHQAGPRMHYFHQPSGLQHQAHTQHHPALQHEHSGQGSGAGLLGHHSSYSGGVLPPNASPFNVASHLANGHASASVGGQPSETCENWQQQVKMHKAAESAHATMIEQNSPHYYARLKAADNRIANSPAPGNGVSGTDSDNDDRRPQLAMATKTAKKQFWTEMDMSGQQIRSLSTNVFKYTFLTKLYISSNRLATLTPAIGELRQLRVLEASHNQLTELPPEIGMCTFLEQLILFNNQLQELPHQLGSLPKLEVLGIEGNNLNDPDIRDFLRKNGTQAYIAHLREKLPVPMPPIPRKPIVVQEDVSPNLERVKVLSWNILADRYATDFMYGYTPKGALKWDYRSRKILEEIRDQDADFVCLQEVTKEACDRGLDAAMESLEYKVVYFSRSRARTMQPEEKKTVDGCAIYYKANKFFLLNRQVDQQVIYLGQGDSFAKLSNERMEVEDIYNRVMPKDNIAIAGFFESYATGARFVVVNTHLAWEGDKPDVKLVQTALILETVAKFFSESWKNEPLKSVDEKRKKLRDVKWQSPKGSGSVSDDKDGGEGGGAGGDSQEGGEEGEEAEEPVFAPSMGYWGEGKARAKTNDDSSEPIFPDIPADLPVILCGDFNSTGESGVYKLLSEGKVDHDHPEWTNPESGRRWKYGRFTGHVKGEDGKDGKVGRFAGSENGKAKGRATTPREFLGCRNPFVPLRSAYHPLVGTPDELPFTNYTPGFTDVIDYIWYTSNSLQVVKLLGPPDVEHLKRVPGFPNYFFPSDHIHLVSEFVVKARKGDKDRISGR